MDNEQQVARALRDNAERFAHKATQLSNRLAYAVDFLNSLEGKIDVRVTDGYAALSFERQPGGEWFLLYSTPDACYELTQASILLKAKAAKLLPKLFDKLMQESELRLAAVEEALEALNEIPFLPFGNGE